MKCQLIIKDADELTEEVIFEGSWTRCVEVRLNYIVAAPREKTYTATVQPLNRPEDASVVTVVADPYAGRSCGW